MSGNEETTVTMVPAKPGEIEEYKDAVAAFAKTHPGTRVHEFAKEVIVELYEKEIVFYIDCILCHNKFDYVVTVGKAAQYTDQPRGICGKH